MKAITILYREDGTSEMLAGPEVPANQQRTEVRALRGALPEGVLRVECRELSGAKLSIAAREAVAEATPEVPAPAKAEKPPKAKPAKAEKPPKPPKAESTPAPEPEADPLA